MKNNKPVYAQNKGFILISVVLTLTILATLAFMLSRQSAINAGGVVREHQSDTARYAAEAGYNHAVWQANAANCTGYTNIPDTSFGNHSYTATITDAAGSPLTDGSPVKISTTGTLMDGTSRSLSRDNVKIYQAPTTTILQPDAASGKDAEIWDQQPNNNYGAAAETWVSSASNDTTRTLLGFNMNTIPVGVRILQANLSLHRQSGSGANQPVAANRITNPWSEDSVTWNSRETGTNWDTAGADFDNMAVATTPVGPANQRYEWNIAPLVQGWVDGSYPNYGVALTAAIAGMSGERFYTSDDNDPTRHPSLTITYACECGTTCTTDGAGGNLLMVVVDPANLTPSEVGKKTQVEAWGYTVSLIDESDSQSAFDAALVSNIVVYISEDVLSTEVGTKLTGATIGVVTEEDNLSDEFGLSDGIVWQIGTVLDIVDNSHYITQPFTLGPLTVLTTSQYMSDLTGTLAPDLNVLGNTATGSALAAVNAGASVIGGTAAGRRVQLPWGDTPFEINRLNTDGLTLFERALAWGAGTGDDGNSTFETRVASGNDDAEQRIGDGYTDTTSSDLELAYDIDGSGTDLVGIRFTGVNVPQGSTISNAYVQFQTDELRSGTTNLNIRGENTDDAAQFTTTSFDISGRTPTSASVPWIPPAWNTVGEAGLDQQTPNIATVIQEIIDRSGWSSGNALVITVSGTGTRTAESYNGDPGGAPLLHIEYSDDGGGGGGGGSCNGNFHDQFNTRTFDGDDGGLSWAGPWQEVGENDGATSGDILIMEDEDGHEDHFYKLRTRDNDNGGEGVEREADLTGAASATLDYKYRRQGLDSSSDYTLVEVSANGTSGPWTELTRHQGSGNDGSYQSANHDISAWISANTRIRFKTSSNMGGTDTVWFDNIQIQCSP